ncbi:MAG: oligosaccharide flippase family protein [Bacteroidales bacterium]|nr:oligosaccharide flippase family protein [Bacteroidales bacterium]
MRIPRFIKDSGTLVSGQVAAQLIAFAAYPLLTRLFTPADFGLYNVFYSYIEVFIILSTGKYELSIVAAKSDAEAYAIARMTLGINTCVSLLLLTVVLALTLAGVHLSPLVPSLALLIPFMVFFCGTTRVYSVLCNRGKRYRTIAAGEVTTSTAGVALKAAAGGIAPLWGWLHTAGLPLGTVAGKAAGNLYYRLRVGRLPKTDRATARSLMHTHRNFPLYVMPKEFVSSFSANLPFLWLAAYFDNAAIGLFSLALTFTIRPVRILNNAFEAVFYADTTQKVRQGQPIGASIRRFVLVLNAAAIPLMVAGFFYAEPVFTFLFGDKWIGTGYYVRCLIPWLWVMLTANSLMFVSNIFGTQRVDFFFQIALLALRVAALGAGLLAHDFGLAVLLFSAASGTVQLALLGWYLFQVHRYDRHTAHP